MQQHIWNIRAPLMTPEKYAEMCGLEPSVVHSQVVKRTIPTVKQGRHLMVNVALIFKNAVEAESWDEKA
jgi:hypothetical protein